MIVKILVAFIGLVAISNAKTFENYKVYKVVPNSVEEVQILTDLRKSGFEFWTDAFTVGNDVRIMVAPNQEAEFVRYSKSVGLSPELRISNVQE